MSSGRAIVAGALRARDVAVSALAGCAIVVVHALTVGTPFGGERGALGAVVLGWPALTYALAGALFAAALAGVHTTRFADVLHASGYGGLRLLASASAAGLAVATGVFTVAWAALFAVGALESGFQLAAPFPLDAGALTRLVAKEGIVFLAAGLLGAYVGVAAGRRLVAVVVVAVLTLPYAPFVAATSSRFGPLFDGLPYLPFGAIRATLDGNGAVATEGLDAARWISPALAGGLAAAWLLAAAAAALLRLRGTRPWATRTGVRGLALAGALVASAAVGAVVPDALSDTVPWRWQPVWRHATSSGWATHQVARSWAETLRSGGSVDALYAPGAARPPAEATAPLRLAARIDVPGESDLVDPLHAEVRVVFDPPVRRPGVEIGSASYLLELRRVGDRYLVAAVQGPALGPP